jgi:hypothetical protein
MLQTTTAEVRPDEAKQCVSAPLAQSVGCFDCLLRPWIRVLPLPKTPDRAILAPQPPGIWGISVKGFFVREASVTEVKASRRRIEPMDSAAFLWLGGDGYVAKTIMNWNSAFHSLV